MRNELNSNGAKNKQNNKKVNKERNDWALSPGMRRINIVIIIAIILLSPRENIYLSYKLAEGRERPVMSWLGDCETAKCLTI